MTQRDISWSPARRQSQKGFHVSEPKVRRQRGHKWAYVVVCSICGQIGEDLPYTDAMAFHANELAMAHDRKSNPSKPPSGVKPPIVGRSWV